MKTNASKLPIEAGECQQPVVTNIAPALFNHSQTNDVVITGFYFTATTTVTITGQTINSVTYDNPGQLTVNVTSNATDGLYDVVVSNNCGTETIQDGFEVKLSTWFDLRQGGDAFTHGNAAGNDVRYRSGMTMGRDADGIWFTGVNPWGAWVKFPILQWNRSTPKTLQWIMKVPSSFMMIGIGSDATDEANNSQWGQAEWQMYFNSSTNRWGYYGNNGSLGTAQSQSSQSSVASASVLKLKFENNGANGETISLYSLPSANPSDWDDESNLIIADTSINTADEAVLMPFIIPLNNNAHRYTALKVE